MNRAFLTFTTAISIALALTSNAFAATPAPGTGDFAGAKPEPMGRVKESLTQLRIRFPEEIVKSANKESFQVSCAPKADGFSGWADNNTVWTFDFKAASEDDSPRLPGGTKCQISQINDVTSSAGTVWKAGTINYSVIVGGPNVLTATPALEFKGSLRETDPVLLLTFDGPVDPAKFFSEQNGYLNYLSANAPSEKIPLAPVPQDQAQKIFEHFKATDYSEVNFEDRTWILATVKQNLIPGAQVKLTVENQASADNGDVRADSKFTQDFNVRSQFQAEVQCANPSAKNGNCLPGSAITVALNGMVKWGDIKDAYIEYIPFKSKDRKTVRSYAEIEADRKIGFWDNIINMLAQYFPFLAKYSDTVVDAVVFNVNIEPQTQAVVVLPKTLTDLDGRILSNALNEFHIRIGAMDEFIRVPKAISFFEKNVSNVYLPVGVVNMNQKLSIRKTGTDAKVWAPIRDFPTMIQLIRAYQTRGDYRTTPGYTSPMEELKIASTVVPQQMTGVKNRPTVLQFPFGNAKAAPQTSLTSGMYGIEVSSPSFEESRSDAKDHQYYNPKYVLAQVTDLAVHLKKGANSHVAWVTHLSSALPASGAQVEIYNCLGKLAGTYTADASGLVSFPNREWAKDCAVSQDENYGVFAPDHFYVAARLGDDFAMIHSSWETSGAYPSSAPGVEFFSSNVRENEPYYHAVIGVNLVKPGQQVPIEILAKMPVAKGFSEIPAAQLATKVRIVSNDDDAIFYEFPLTWNAGKAEIQWQVPSDASVRLGVYSLEMRMGDQSVAVTSGDIEVGEFKVPLMSGLIAFPNDELVQPASIPVNSVIRYANGVGAKKLGVDLSYYFAPTQLQNKSLANFAFGTGPVTPNDDAAGENGALPTGSRPAVIQGLTTGDDGSLVRDLALEKVGDGRTVAEVLKNSDRPQKLVVRVRYQDQVGEFQTLSQAKDIYNSSVYVGTNLVAGSRADAKLQAAVVDVKSNNITSIDDLDLKVIRIETRVIGEELFGGLIKNTLERELKPVRWTPNCTMQNKVVNCPVGALKDGTYAFEVTSKSSRQSAHLNFKVDTDGRVYGPHDYFDFGDDEGGKQLPLALNKATYKNGDRAVVSFAPPFKACPALVTIERDDVLQSFVVPNACEKGQVEVPVDATLAPNAFVSVYAITGRAATAAVKVGETDLGRPTYRIGFANMKVNWGHFKSNVIVKTDKDVYEPGDDVNVTVQVKAEEGQLAATSVTLIALEEKILELKPNDTYAVLESLMQMRQDNVTTVSALERVETVTVDNADQPEAADARKGGDDGGDGSSKAEFKRKLFNALVAFKPNVPVANGVATISFKANDSLTRFKVIAIATDSNQKFGTGSAEYLSEKDIQTYSNTPSVGHTGDSFPLKVTAQNNSAAAAKFKAEIAVTVKDRNGNVISQNTLSKDATIDKASSQAIDVGQVTVPENASRIEYTVKVYNDKGQVVDEMEPDAEVILPAVPLEIHDSLIAQVENGAFSKVVVKDAAALASQGQIRVNASRSLVASALTQIGQRLEQEKFADLFIETRLTSALVLGSETKPEQVKAALDAILGDTDSNGFVKYYPQAPRGSVWLTASLLNALQNEPWAVKLMSPALSEKLKGAVSLVLTKSVPAEYIGKDPMNWLDAQVVMGRAAFTFNDAELIASAKAVNTTITTNLKRDPKAYGTPVEKWTNNEVVERWLLEVWTTPETALTSDTYKQLTSSSRLVYSGNMAQLNGAPRYAFFYSDETIETSKLELGLSRVKGDKGLAKSIAMALVNANLKGWYNALTMANVAQGLKAFGRGYEAEPVTGIAVLSIPETRATASVDFGSKLSGGLSSDWTTSQATVKVSHAGQGQPWVSVQALSAVPLTQPRGQGLSIEKSTRNVTRESGYQAGDIIEVTLNVHSNASLNHVAMLDPIPSGSNILSDAYGDYSSGQKSYSGYKLYFEQLPNGVTTVKYQYQLNNPGTFQLPPTRAEGLYMPSLFAETPNAVMKVQ